MGVALAVEMGAGLDSHLILRDGAVFIADAHYIPHTDGAVLEAMICEQGVEAALESLRSVSEHGLRESLVLESSALDSGDCARQDCTRESSKEAKLDSHVLDSGRARYLRYVGEHGLLGLLAHLAIELSTKLSGGLTRQVFLMGDVAHLFLPHISTRGHEAFIALINTLATYAEVFYLEGNHDFGLDSRIMPDVRIYPRCLQPLLCARALPKSKAESRRRGAEQGRYGGWIWLAHGDLFISRIYEAYIRSISAPFTLSVLKLLNTLSAGSLYCLVQRRVNAKKIRTLRLDSGQFEAFMQKRMEQYAKYPIESSKLDSGALWRAIEVQSEWGMQDVQSVQSVIEGHFHIGRAGEWIPKNIEQSACGEYFALPSFYCDKRIFVL